MKKKATDFSLFRVCTAQKTPLDKVARFLEAGADPNRQYAVRIGHMSEEGSALVGHVAAGEASPAVISALVEGGARVDETTSRYRRTALHAAASGDHAAAVTRLCELGADVGAVDWQWMSPLHLAARENAAGAIEALLACGADPTRNNSAESGRPQTALAIAAWIRAHEAAEALLAGGAAPGGGGLGPPPLHFAEVSMLGMLVRAGADPDQPDPDGVTALMKAVEYSYASGVDQLLELGASPSLAVSGVAPIYLAVEKGSAATIRALLRSGARSDERGPVGTALELAASLPAADLLLRLLGDTGAALRDRPAGLLGTLAELKVPIHIGEEKMLPSHPDGWVAHHHPAYVPGWPETRNKPVTWIPERAAWILDQDDDRARTLEAWLGEQLVDLGEPAYGAGEATRLVRVAEAELLGRRPMSPAEAAARVADHLLSSKGWETGNKEDFHGYEVQEGTVIAYGGDVMGYPRRDYEHRSTRDEFIEQHARSYRIEDGMLVVMGSDALSLHAAAFTTD